MDRDVWIALLLASLFLSLSADEVTSSITSVELTDMRTDVLDANVAAAERKPLPSLTEINDSWLQWMSRLPLEVIKFVSWPIVRLFFRRRDRLRENILDDQSREDYDRIRGQYVAMARERYSGDAVVEAIVTGQNERLWELLRAGEWRDVTLLHPYIDIAEMMPNEAALYMLIGELDYQTSSSPELLGKLFEIDYVSILGSLVTPHIRAGHFKRLFAAHPPENQAAFLADVLETAVRSTPEVFVEWVAACYDLAARNKSSIRSIIKEFEDNKDYSNRPPLNVAVGLFYIYLENQKGAHEFGWGREMISGIEYIEEGAILMLRGLNAVVEYSNALARLLTGSKMWQSRLEAIAKLALQYDPKMKMVIEERLIGLLDLYRVLQLQTSATSQHGLLEQINQGMAGLRGRNLGNLPLPILSFVLRTRLVSREEAQRVSTRFFFFSAWTKYQRALIELMALRSALANGHSSPCTNKLTGVYEITHLAVGHILRRELFEQISYGDSQTLVYALLSTVFELPESAFTVDKPLGHLPPVLHLNRRMRTFCNETHPSIIFEEQPLNRKTIVWTTKENLKPKPAKMSFHKNNPKEEEIKKLVPPPDIKNESVIKKEPISERSDKLDTFESTVKLEGETMPSVVKKQPVKKVSKAKKVSQAKKVSKTKKVEPVKTSLKKHVERVSKSTRTQPTGRVIKSTQTQPTRKSKKSTVT